MKPSRVFLLSAFIATVSFVMGSYCESYFNKEVPFLVTDTVTVFKSDTVAKSKIVQTKSKKDAQENID